MHICTFQAHYNLFKSLTPGSLGFSFLHIITTNITSLKQFYYSYYLFKSKILEKRLGKTWNYTENSKESYQASVHFEK